MVSRSWAARSPSTTPSRKWAKSPSVDSRMMTKSSVARPRIGERTGDAGDGADRPHAGIEAELHAQVDLRHDLGAVGIADRRVAHGGEQDRIGSPRLRQRGGGERLAGVAIGAGTGGEPDRRNRRRRLSEREPARSSVRQGSVISWPMPSPAKTAMRKSLLRAVGKSGSFELAGALAWPARHRGGACRAHAGL